MDLREQRGLELAATRTISQKSGIWIVPSQAGKGTYRVHLMSKIASCTCPDHETRRMDCKHIYAARFVMRRERNADGSTTVTESVTLTATKQTTYPQAWSAYKRRQTSRINSSPCSTTCALALSPLHLRRVARVCPCRIRCSISRSRSTARFRNAVSCPT